MEQNIKIVLGNSSIIQTDLNRKDRNKFRETFIKWLDEFKDIFTDLNLNFGGINVSVHFNWGKLSESLMDSYDYNIPVNEIKEDYHLYTIAHPDEKISFDEFFYKRRENSDEDFIIVDGVIIHSADEYNALDYVLQLVFHIWRCCNISFPGVISLFNVEVIIDNKSRTNLSLNSEVLGQVYNSEFINCYQIKPLNLKKTWNWYCKVIDMGSIVTKNRFDRTISSLFNYVRQNSFLQSDIVNLFLGAEAFYDLKNRAIKDTLKKRGVEFLTIQNNKKKFIQGISDFYDYRSRFIHGDLEIISCMDILENFLIDVPEYDKYYSVCQFGVFFILASLQTAIEMDCISLSYIETAIINDIE